MDEEIDYSNIDFDAPNKDLRRIIEKYPHLKREADRGAGSACGCASCTIMMLLEKHPELKPDLPNYKPWSESWQNKT